MRGNGVCPETANTWITISLKSVSASKVHFSLLSNAGRLYPGATFIKAQVKLLLLSPVTQLCSQTWFCKGDSAHPCHILGSNTIPTQVNAPEKLRAMGCQRASCTWSSLITSKMSSKIHTAVAKSGVQVRWTCRTHQNFPLSQLPPLKTPREELDYLQVALDRVWPPQPCLPRLTSSLGSRLSSSLNAVPTRLLTWGGSSPAPRGYSLGILPVSSWGTEGLQVRLRGRKGLPPARPQGEVQLSPLLAGRFSSAPPLSEAVFPEGVSLSSLAP